MLKLTQRILAQVYALREASIRFESSLDPALAIMLSFEDARAFYYDLLRSPNTQEIRMFVNEMPFSEERRINPHSMSHDLHDPPYPDGRHVVWASLEGIQLAIKGREDQ